MTSEQTQMKALIALLAVKNAALVGDDFNNVLGVKKLDLDGAITVIYPSGPYGDKAHDRAKPEHMFAFNAHDVPSTPTLEDYAKMMKEEGFEYITADFVFADGSFVHPMGVTAIGYGDMQDFHKAVSGHSARATRTSNPEEFDNDWSGKGNKAALKKDG